MLNTREIPPEAILLGVYLELQNGQISIRHSLTHSVHITSLSQFEVVEILHIYCSQLCGVADIKKEKKEKKFFPATIIKPVSLPVVLTAWMNAVAIGAACMHAV